MLTLCGFTFVLEQKNIFPSMHCVCCHAKTKVCQCTIPSLFLTVICDQQIGCNIYYYNWFPKILLMTQPSIFLGKFNQVNFVGFFLKFYLKMINYSNWVGIDKCLYNKNGHFLIKTDQYPWCSVSKYKKVKNIY